MIAAEEYLTIIIVVFILSACSETFRYYSGVQFILEKIKPSDNNRLPTFPLWIIGIYIALFGVASNRYESRVDIIENRINGIYAQISKGIHLKGINLTDAHLEGTYLNESNLEKIRSNGIHLEGLI